MWGWGLRAHRGLQRANRPLEVIMFQHHLITVELADLRRREIVADAAGHRRVARNLVRTHRILRHR
jgi:hypothetical protein